MAALCPEFSIGGNGDASFGEGDLPPLNPELGCYPPRVNEIMSRGGHRAYGLQSPSARAFGFSP